MGVTGASLLLTGDAGEVRAPRTVVWSVAVTSGGMTHCTAGVKFTKPHSAPTPQIAIVNDHLNNQQIRSMVRGLMLATMLQRPPPPPSPGYLLSHMSLSKPTGRQSPTVLVVDDDADARLIYSEYLRAKGCVVVTASDGRAAIDKAMDLIPDAVVLDLAMPRVDGWTALKHLRESSWTAGIPIVVLTALCESRDQAFEAGCDAYLAKPCSPDVLWMQLRRLFRLHPQLRAPYGVSQ